jgi:hypothetical protein
VIAAPFTVTLAPTDIRHEVDRNLAVIEAIGGTIAERHLELWPLPAHRRDVATRLEWFQDCCGPLVALAPGASSKLKRWPTERFIAVSLELIHRLGAKIVVLGGAGERDAGSEIASRLGSCTIDLTGQLDLNRTFAAIEACSLLISNDSAPVHLASAAGTPVVVLSPHALNGNANASLSPLRFGPYLTSHRTLQPAILRDPCRETCTAADAHCILEISTDAVIDASLELLQAQSQSIRQAPAIASASDLAAQFTRDVMAIRKETGDNSPKVDGTGVVRRWQNIATQQGADWKETQASSKLRFLLHVLGKTPRDLLLSRVLIVNDGPLQTLGLLRAKLCVAIDPNTDALIEAGLLDPALNNGNTSYISASITSDLLPERHFDTVLVSCSVHGRNDALRLLKAAFRVAAPNARIALNLSAPMANSALSPGLVAAALYRREHTHDVVLLGNKNAIRGAVVMRG